MALTRRDGNFTVGNYETISTKFPLQFQAKSGALDMTRWFRFYHEALNDPKVQSLEPELFKHWINLLCIASQHDGYLPEMCNVSFLLRVTVSDVTHIIEALQGHGLIDVSSNQHAANYKMHGWDKRQYKSDTSAERVRQHRKRKRNVTVTPPDTDTDTDTDNIETPNGVLCDSKESARKINDIEFEQFKDRFPKQRWRDPKKVRAKIDRLLRDKIITVPELIAAVQSRNGFEADDEYSPMPITWLNQERWNASPPTGVEPEKIKLTQEEIERRIAEADGR